MGCKGSIFFSIILSFSLNSSLIPQLGESLLYLFIIMQILINVSIFYNPEFLSLMIKHFYVQFK